MCISCFVLHQQEEDRSKHMLVQSLQLTWGLVDAEKPMVWPPLRTTRSSMVKP